MPPSRSYSEAADAPTSASSRSAWLHVVRANVTDRRTNRPLRHPHRVPHAEKAGALGRRRPAPAIDARAPASARSSFGRAVLRSSIRLAIESVFSNLKRQMRLGDHLAKTVGGLAQRVAQRLHALTLGIFCHLLVGRPARALVAYDGR